ncbi:YveK family protein [Bacillus sp. JJ1562]|uniref:YveK family protein n=1 Tax=Bacillus sp. JJ1562 TaxID=3122960 RepID=UPI0030028DAA
MEDNISLREFFHTLRKRAWLITIMTAVIVAIVGVVSFFFLTPIYQSTTQILVNQNTSNQPYFNQSEIRTNIDLTTTYNEIIMTPAILDLVKEELNLTGSLNKIIRVGSSYNSQVIKISVQHTEPQTAVKIANTTADVFKKEIVKIMNVDNVSILSPAQLPENSAPEKPNQILNMAIALVVGLMTSIGLAFLLEYLDNTVRTEQDIARLLELPALGSISKMDLKVELTGKYESGKRTRVRGDSLGT